MPAELGRDRHVPELVAAVATVVAHTLWSVALGGARVESRGMFVDKEADDLFRVDLRNVPAVRARMATGSVAAMLEALALGNLDDAVGFLTRAVRNYYYSGSFAFLLGPLALTAVLLHRLGRAEQAARLLGWGRARLVEALAPTAGAASKPSFRRLPRAGGSRANLPPASACRRSACASTSAPAASCAPSATAPSTQPASLAS